MWNISRCIAFRFGFIMGLLFVFPFPLWTLPKMEWLAEKVSTPLGWLALWFGESVLGLDPPSEEPSGSGDTTYTYVWLLLMVIIAAVGTIVWSVVDRRRTAYPSLAKVSVVVLRFVLAAAMLGYGFAKVFDTQFPSPSPLRLDERVGEMSPMGMLWTFMGSSIPYTMFAGFAEVVGGTLLIWRRTATLGALIVMAVMTNVVMLNMCYDVPVKLYSMQLLLCACVIAAPQMRRVLAAVLGYATAEVPVRPRMSRRREWARLVAKVVFVVSCVYEAYDHYEALRYRWDQTELTGIWVVDSWSADGVDRPPLGTDKERWRRLAVSARGIAIRMMTDERVVLRAKTDVEKRTITVTEDKLKETWGYQLKDPRRLVIDGKWGGRQLHVTLTREPDPLLVTRGFNWIQEQPFNK